MKKTNQPEEEMTVELTLEDGAVVQCAVVTILEANEQEYIALLPLGGQGENEDGEVWFYRYHENPDDPDEEPVLDFIDSDEELELVEEAFDEFLDNCEFDELKEE